MKLMDSCCAKMLATPKELIFEATLSDLMLKLYIKQWDNFRYSVYGFMCSCIDQTLYENGFHDKNWIIENIFGNLYCSSYVVLYNETLNFSSKNM